MDAVGGCRQEMPTLGTLSYRDNLCPRRSGSCSGRDCKDMPTRPGEAITQGSLATLISFVCARVPAGFIAYPWTHGTESPHGLASPRISFFIFNSL